MIKENRLYRRKRNGIICKIYRIHKGIVYGTFMRDDLIEFDSFNCSLNDFTKAVYKKPLKVTNTVKNVIEQDKPSYVFYTKAVVCCKISTGELTISVRSLNSDSAYNSMGRMQSELKAMGYEDRYKFLISDLHHELA
jgi:hypothetical protein